MGIVQTGRPNLHAYMSISQLPIHVKSEYLYLDIHFQGTDKKIFLEIFIHQNNFFMNSMAEYI